ncbi:phage holin family protein [Coprothermobacteraceae bacterium]|nr:phage holin family protein [Coprothermobacteraceae bacterium]
MEVKDLFVRQWLLNFVVLALVSLLYKGIQFADLTALVLGSLVFTAAQFVIKPVLVFLSLPVTILTFGLFLLVINGVIVWLMAEVVPGIYLTSFGAAIITWVLISLIGLLLKPFML